MVSHGTEKVKTEKVKTGKVKTDSQTNISSTILSVFHTIMVVFAIYLSFRCNNGFHFGAFLASCCCPQLYIMYAAAFNGLCIVTGESNED